jgi:hypothetical protein
MTSLSYFFTVRLCINFDQKGVGVCTFWEFFNKLFRSPWPKHTNAISNEVKGTRVKSTKIGFENCYCCYECNPAFTNRSNWIIVSNQGDQIRRIWAYWPIVYFSQFLKISELPSQIFDLLFQLTNSTKYVMGYFLGDFSQSHLVTPVSTQHVIRH